MDYQALLHPKTSHIEQDAGFLRRLCAFIFDLLVLDIIITAPFTSIFQDFLERAKQSQFTNISYTNQEFAATILLFALLYAYFVLFEYLLGQTIGMMICKTSVKGKNSFIALCLRNSYILPFFPFIVFWIVEPIAIIFSRRGVLERLSNTRTLHEQDMIL